MAACKVMFSMRHQLQKILAGRLSTQLYSSDATYSERFEEVQAFSRENRPQPIEDIARSKEPEGLNEIFLMGSVVSNFTSISEGRGSTFYLDITQSRRDGGEFRVRSRVLAYNSVLPEELKETLDLGSRVLIKGRLGSRLDRNLDGSPGNISNFVVARSITVL